MIETLSRGLVLVFGISIGVACVISVYSPHGLIRFVRTSWDKQWTIYVAVLARLILGAALIFAAPVSRFPVGFTVLGWMAIVAAILIPLAGRERVGNLLDWFAKSPPLLVRLWLLFGLLFCCVLIYGSW